MASGPSNPLIRHLRRIAGLPGDGGGTDGQLLEAFVSQRDEAAFEALLGRHGPMVLAACRRVLQNTHDVEDAFQATFLVLCRKAGSISNRESVGGWLYQVACRIALRVKAETSRQAACESLSPDLPASDAPHELDWHDLRPILDEELSRLPEKYRPPLVLHYLEGKTVTQVAHELGWRHGTVLGRLARARDRSRTRLTRRGLSLTTGALAAALTQQAPASSVPFMLTKSTLKMTSLFLLGPAVLPGTVATKAIVLAQGALQAMLVTKLKLVAMFALAVGVVTAGTGVLTHHAMAEKQAAADPAEAPQPPPKDARRPRPNPVEEQPARTDRYRDPLPEGAIARLGTTRFRAGGSINLMAFLPDRKTLLTVEQKEHDTHICRLWEAATGKALRAFGDQQGDFLRSAALSPDAKILATGWFNSRKKEDRIVLWDVATGKELRTLEGLAIGLLPIAFAPDGKTSAAAGGDKTIRLWDPNTGDEVRQFKVRQADWVCLAFSPDGKTLVAGSRLGNVCLWDVEAGKELHKLDGHANFVDALVFSPDGKTLAAASDQQEFIRLWDVATGKEVRSFTRVEEERPRCLAFSPDGKVLASGCFASTKTTQAPVRLWDVATGKELRQLRGHLFWVSSLAFFADGKTLASGGTNEIHLWDLATGNELLPLPEPRSHVQSIAYSPDGRLVATGNLDHTIRLWEPTTGQLIRQFEGGHTDRVWHVVFSPDGQTLASAGNDNTIRIWDVVKGREVRRLPGGEKTVLFVAYSPDGRTLATSGRDRVVRLWDAATGKELRQLAGLHEYLVRATFSPDGKRLAAVSMDRGASNGTILVWDTATGKEVRRWATPQRALVIFSPDGKLLAGGENQTAPATDVTLHLWDLATGKERRFTISRRARVFAGVFSPDGKTFALGLTDGSIHLCELATGQVRRQLDGHLAGVQSLAFSPGGTALTSGSEDTTALVPFSAPWPTLQGATRSGGIRVGP